METSASFEARLAPLPYPTERMILALKAFNNSEAKPTSLIPGSSHGSYKSRSRMTGIRSLTTAVTAFGVVVRIEQVSSALPLAFYQRSQIPAKANSSPSLTSKHEWLLRFPHPLPLVERVGGNQAPATFQCISERRLHACSFGSCIDHLSHNRRVFSPRWNESPENKRHFPDRLLRILTDDRDTPGRGDVISGIPVMFHPGGVEILFNNLFPPL
jgi:hypothetical protein